MKSGETTKSVNNKDTTSLEDEIRHLKAQNAALQKNLSTVQSPEEKVNDTVTRSRSDTEDGDLGTVSSKQEIDTENREASASADEADCQNKAVELAEKVKGMIFFFTLKD